MQRGYLELDVFSTKPLSGNPLGVVLDATGLSTDDMQRFANWTNFSETTFLLPPQHPDADYLVRIFTPGTELPFAGHPTLGSCHAWLSMGGIPRRPGRVVQECGAGLVPVAIGEQGQLAFAAPELRRDGPVDETTLSEVVAVLGIEPGLVVDARWIDNGPGWLGVLLPTAADVLALRPRAQTTLAIGVFGPYAPGHPAAYEVRAFFPERGNLLEDPVTGSLNASGAQWLVASGRFTPPYAASQGHALGRAGRVLVSADDTGAIWIGGNVTTCVSGAVDL
ncbi:MAG: PhzF family phenazine biosynthesis protein [Actinomycetota bacterium]|nr:PhzF family phenazine biosynthesis protein [Actinomycetota bacterium]